MFRTQTSGRYSGKLGSVDADIWYPGRVERVVLVDQRRQLAPVQLEIFFRECPDKGLADELEEPAVRDVRFDLGLVLPKDRREF